MNADQGGAGIGFALASQFLVLLRHERDGIRLAPRKGSV